MYIDECMLACNVCMRYIYCKMANVQSETLILIDPKIFQIKYKSWLSIGAMTYMVLGLYTLAMDT